MTKDVIIRRATRADASAINAVYNPFIETSPATFETEAHDETARAAWLDAHLANERHPVLVAEINARIAGFSNASRFDPRAGYDTSVKTSVFIEPAAQGRGLGRALYAALFAALERTDIHRAYALVVAPNPASAALHVHMGFRQVSTLHEVGRKFGRFHDVMWFEKRL
ncbi:MAG: N-acetyltransferase family protein [Pseudomonadota bacterium]